MDVIHKRPFSLQENLRHIVRRWPIGLVVAAIGIAASFWVKTRFVPEYQAEAMVRLTLRVYAPQLDRTVQIPQEEPLEPLPLSQNLQDEALSDSSLARFVEKNMSHAKLTPAQQKKLFEYWRKYARIVPQTDTLYRVTAQAKSPEQAYALCHWMTLVSLSSYQKMMRERAETLARFTAEQANKAAGTLSALEEKMVSFLRQNPELLVRTMEADRRLNTAGPDRMRVQANARIVTQAGIALSQKDPELRQLMEERTRLRNELNSLDNDGNATTSVATGKLRELRQAQAALNQLRSEGLGDDHPAVKQAIRRVSLLEQAAQDATPGQTTAVSAYAQRVQTRLTAIELQLRTKFAKQNAVSKKLPRLEAAWGELSREQRLLLQRFDGLSRLAVAARFTKGAYYAEHLAAVIEPPNLPTVPKGTQSWMIVAAGSVVAMLLGALVVMLIGLFDKKLYYADDVVQLLRLRLLAIMRAARSINAGSDALVGQDNVLLRWSKQEQQFDLDVQLSPGESRQNELLGDGSTMRIAMNSQTIAPATIVPGSVVMSDLLNDDASHVPLRVRTIIASTPSNPALFLATAPHSEAADQIRRLASQLADFSDPPVRVALIASWEARTGRTMLAANLAMGLAEARRRVLLIDTCGGHASLTRVFGLRPSVETGLYEQLEAWLSGTCNHWTVYQVAQGLFVMPASSVSQPMIPMLSSSAYAEMMRGFREVFDVIVLDSLAMSAASDAVVLAKEADSAVLVVASQRSTLGGADAAIVQLSRSRIWGAVFNEHRAKS